MFFSKKKKINEIDMSRLPQHIGIIMDGNGRWAKKRGLPRSAGHSAGADSLKKIITEANNLGVKYITCLLYTSFSPAKNTSIPATGHLYVNSGLFQKFSFVVVYEWLSPHIGHSMSNLYLSCFSAIVTQVS